MFLQNESNYYYNLRHYFSVLSNMSLTIAQHEVWKLYFDVNQCIPDVLVTIPESVTMTHLPLFTPFSKSLEFKGFLSSPPSSHARTYKDYVFLPNSQRPNIFGDLSKAQARCAYFRENGLRV